MIALFTRIFPYEHDEYMNYTSPKSPIYTGKEATKASTKGYSFSLGQ